MDRVKHICREPLVHFILIGAGLFLLFGLKMTPDVESSNQIVIKSSQTEQLAARFSSTWMRQPSEKELTSLIDAHIRDEVYYREAIALGLDQNDPQVRRRLRQKLEFLLEDLTVEESPGDDKLSAFLAEHPDKFQIEPQISFRQLYLNPDKRQDMMGDAAKILAQLRVGKSPETLGDRTMIQQDFIMVRQSEIARSFGEDFSRKLISLEQGRWQGPFPSGLGGHLVLITDRQEGRLPELAEVRALVERDYLVQRRKELKDLAYEKLLQSYEVTIEPSSAASVDGNPDGALASTLPGDAEK